MAKSKDLMASISNHDDSGYISDGSFSNILALDSAHDSSNSNSRKDQPYSNLDSLQSQLFLDRKKACTRTLSFSSSSPNASNLVILSSSSSLSCEHLSPKINVSEVPSISSISKDSAHLKDGIETSKVVKNGDEDRSVKPKDFLKRATKVSDNNPNIVLKMMEEAEYLLIKVLMHLSPAELVKVSHVCNKLRNIVLRSSFMNSQRLSYLQTMQHKKEMIGKENFGKEKHTRMRFSLPSPRKHLQQLQNAISPKKNLVQSTSFIPNATSPKKNLAQSTSLFDRFVKEGQKLLPGEVQQKCIRCQFPARIIKNEFKAICSSKNCGFCYCTRCYLAYHSTTSECLLLKPRISISTTSTKILAKVCKKRLRRL